MQAPGPGWPHERLLAASGGALGAVAVAGAWALCLTARGLPWTVDGLRRVHAEVPLLLGIDLIPVLAAGITAAVLWGLRRTSWAWAGARRGRLPAVPVCLVRVGPDGRVEDMNRSAEVVLGWAAGDARGRPFDVLVPDLPVHEPPTLKRTVRGDVVGSAWRGRARHRDGSTLEVEVSLAQENDGPGRVYVVCDQDTRRSTPEGLEARARLLEDLGTELRAPVNVAAASCALALEEVSTTGCAALEGDLQRIAGACERLRLLGDDLLDLSRLQSCAIPTRAEEVDVAALVRSVAADLEPDPERLAVDDREVPTVRTDPQRLQRIVFHLVDAALRAAHGRKVTVRASCAQGMVCVDVSGATLVRRGLRFELVEGLSELIGARLRGDAQGTLLQLPLDAGWGEIVVDGDATTAPLVQIDAALGSVAEASHGEPALSAAEARWKASLSRARRRERRWRRRLDPVAASAAESVGSLR